MLAVIQVTAAASEAQKISFQKKDATLLEVLQSIEQQTGYFYVFDAALLQKASKVNIVVKKADIYDVLNAVFRDQPLTYTIDGRTIVVQEKIQKNTVPKEETLVRDAKHSKLLPPVSTVHPDRLLELINLSRVTDRMVRGKVSDEKGDSLPGVSILVKGTQRGLITDSDGRFSIEVPNENAVLIFSFVGYLTQEVKVESRTSIDIALAVDEKNLEEVVVVGYGTQSRRNVTGSIAKIDMKQTENLPNTNIGQALRGRVAGVQFIDSGRPGQSGSILVRGQRSISASNYPLIIMDGIFFNGSLSDISPNDIESMEILKDASAGAIYGSRAANGVILITSKKGTTEKPTIRFNTYFGTSSWSNQIRLLGPERYIEKTLEYRRQNGQVSDPSQILKYLSTSEQANYTNGTTINPWDEISQKGSIQSYDVSISGRSGRTNYYLSSSLVKEKGVIYNDKSDRVSIRSNIETKITRWLSIGINSQYVRRDLSGVQATITNAYWLSPYGNMYYNGDKDDPQPYPTDDNLNINPLFDARTKKNEVINHNLFANFYTQIEIPRIKGLNYRLNFSPNYRWAHNYSFAPVYRKNGLNNLGNGSKNNSENLDWVLENILSYSTSFGRDHALDVTLLYGTNHFGGESTTATGTNFFNDALHWNNLSLASTQQITSTASEQNGVSSMARVNYRWKDRYIVTLTGRRDGASVFGADNKYAIFPSAAFSWIISEESFLKRASAVNLLKIRLSHGALGNQAISPYQSLGSSSNSARYVYGDGSSPYIGTFPSRMANSGLKWESTSSTNAAVDFDLWEGRVQGSFEYYKMSTKDLLLTRALPSMNGFSNVLSNIGATTNSGMEITINTVNIRRKTFEWSSSFLFSKNRNRIVHLYKSDNNKDGIEDDDLGNRWFIGQPINVNFDYVLDGVYQEGDEIPTGYKPGFFKIKDTNGDGVISPNDRKVLSQKEPKYRLGFNTNLNYKQFSLSVFANALLGWEHQFNLLGTFDKNFPGRPINMIDMGWWTPENRSNERPSLIYTNPLGHGYYTSRDFVRIQDVSLAYNFSSNVLSALKVSTLKVYLSGKNLYTFTDYPGFDPENGAELTGSWLGQTYPMPRSVIFGINLGF